MFVKPNIIMVRIEKNRKILTKWLATLGRGRP